MYAWPPRPLRLGATALAVLLLCGSPAVAADFGNPPSGEIPILYNDHTVYTKPDVLTRNRVLAALIKDGHIYVPLRSMFEEMGATVTASTNGKTITAAKAGVTVSVTLGSSYVIFNGESRPLDVPPMLYKGIVLVPVRVLSEALGAYVQWVPDRHIVVVRYIPGPAPTAPPTEVPTAAPTPAAPIATPAPAPPPVRRAYGFVQAAFAAPKTWNEFSSGEWCRQSYTVSGAFSPKNSPLAVKIDFHQDDYVTSDNLTNAIGNHYTQFATIDGGVAFTPVFLARQSTLEARIEVQIAPRRIYLGASYLHTENNYGYPQLNAAGFGLEKLPDFRPGLNVFGSVFYYPTANGSYTVNEPASPNFGNVYRQQYQILKYDVGLNVVFAHSPVYLYGGFSGDHFTEEQGAPIGQIHVGPYLGLGVKL